MEGVTVYGHPPEWHMTFGEGALLQPAQERGSVLIRFNDMYTSFCVPTFTHK